MKAKMKLNIFTAAAVAALFVFSAACKKADKQANSPAPSETAVAEANDSTPSKSPTLSTSDIAPTVLIGVYTMSEVQHAGKVTMVPPAYAVTFVFQADGSFTRMSKRKGKVDHTDGGDFQIAGKDALILNVTLSEKDPVSNPKPRTYKFTLSKDARELGLLGSDGKLAIFRKETKGSPN